MNDEKLKSIPPEKRKTPSPDETDDRARGNKAPDAKNAVRTLAAFYLGYLVYQLGKEISAENVSDKAMPWMIAAILLFCAGIVWLIWPEVKRIKEALDSDELR